VSYIGNQPTTAAFLTDQFSANGSGTVFTLSAAPANTNSILVSVSGVLQSPDTYSVSGTALTFSAAPPAGTGNISVRFLGIPASGVTTTAYRTVTEFTATAGQTTFTPPSYTVGYINVYRNGALLGTADYTATNGTTVVLASAASSGDLVVVESFYVSSVLNAIPNGIRSVNTSNLPVGTVLQVASTTKTDTFSSTSTSFVDITGFSVSITPTNSSSKILVFGHITASAGLQSVITGYAQLVRGSTAIGNGAYGIALNNVGDSSFTTQFSFNYLDSPATTSATTYKVQFKGDAATWYINRPSARDFACSSTITVMEIAA
jgi:hypothetical protein